MKKIGPWKFAAISAVSSVICCSLALAGVYWSISKPVISRLDVALASPNKFTQTLSVIDLNNAASLTEIQFLEANNSSGPVAALHLSNSGSIIQAVYLGDDRLRSWKPGNSQPFKEFDLINVIDEKSVAFDAAGLLILNSTQVSTVNDGFGRAETLYGNIDLRNVDNGSPVNVYAKNSDGFRGIVLHPSGKWALLYHAGSGYIERTESRSNTSASNFQLINPEEFWWMSSATFDPTGEVLAVAFEEGMVRLYPFQDGRLISSRQIELGIPDKDQLIPVRKVIFDSSRNWLATLRGDIVSIWKLQDGGKLYWQFAIPSANEIAFDQLGKLLFVGTDSAFEVWDLESKSILQRYPASGVNTLITTPDGRLVIWGDKQGVIHLWGTTAH